MSEKQEEKLDIKKVRRHLRTITKHRHLVFQHCRRCGLFWQGLVHDLSKFSPAEFWVGARYYQGNRSPNDAERQATGASSSWMHHKGRNKHHYEYWTDYQKRPDYEYWTDYNMGETEPKYCPVPMPNKYIIEMFCDRVAACEIYHKNDFDRSQPLAYFDRCRTDKLMHPETAKKIRYLLKLYAEKGEEAFDIIREGKEAKVKKSQKGSHKKA